MNRIIEKKFSHCLIIQSMKKSEWNEHIRKRFKVFANLTQNTNINKDSIKFLTCHCNKTSTSINFLMNGISLNTFKINCRRRKLKILWTVKKLDGVFHKFDTNPKIGHDISNRVLSLKEASWNYRGSKTSFNQLCWRKDWIIWIICQFSV